MTMTESPDDLRGAETLPDQLAAQVRRLARDADLGGCVLEVSHTTHHDPDRYRLRLRHPDRTTTVVSPRLPEDSFRWFVRGLIQGRRGVGPVDSHDDD